MELEQHATSSDGARIFYRQCGSGPAVLLSHASFSSHRAWRQLERALGAAYTVVTWDYRGHGRSDAPDDDGRYGMDQLIDDLAAVHAAAVGDAPAHVGGLSIGGTVAMCYALERPERVRSLLLLNTGPGFKKPEAAADWASMLERSAQKLERVGIAAYLEGGRASAELLGLDPSTEESRAVREAICSSTVPGLVRFARRIAGPIPSLVDRLNEIAAPTLVVAGELDAAFARASQVLAAKIPSATRVEIAGAGHVVNLDRPVELAGVVRSFLAQLPPAPPSP